MDKIKLANILLESSILLSEVTNLNHPMMSNHELNKRLSTKQSSDQIHADISIIRQEIEKLEKSPRLTPKIKRRLVQLRNNIELLKNNHESAILSESSYITDDGKKVPKKCDKCGSKVGVFLQGEPLYKCINKECNKIYGVVKFPN